MLQKKIKYGLCFLLILTSSFLFSQIENQQIVKLYPGIAPGSESWNWTQQDYKTRQQTIAYNVTTPTLTVFKPDSVKPTGQAVVICPGGAFHILSMTHEGFDIARWLNNKGITAFVLKYRLCHFVPKGNPMMDLSDIMKDTAKYNAAKNYILPFAIADGKRAVAYVREHAAEYGIKSNQIGIMGFSAGGAVSTGTALTYDAKSRPDFVVSVYPHIGNLVQLPVPKDAPPLFIAVASNDNFGHNKTAISLYSQWIDAGQSAELHIYNSGGHGFGIRQGYFPANTWIERYYEWLNNL